VTVPTRLSSNQLLTSGRSKEEAGALLRAAEAAQGNISQTLIGAGALASVVAAKRSSGQRDTFNYWPNPTSEFSPPDSYTPPGDGTDPEFDFRFNAGTSNAKSGAWVRQLVRSSAGTTSVEHKVPAKPGDDFLFGAYFKTVSGAFGGGNTGRLSITFYDSSNAVLATFSTDNTGGGGSWVSAGTGSSGGAPAGTVTVGFKISLLTSSAGTFEIWYDEINAFRLIDAITYIKSGSIAGTLIADGSVQDTKLGARGGGMSGTGIGGPSLLITNASGWTDIPSCSISYTVRNSGRTALWLLTFSGYVDTATGSMQVRFLIDGTPLVTPAYGFFYNAGLQHQGWSFQYSTAASAIGSTGTTHTLKAQLFVNQATMRFSMDANDHAELSVFEIG
jgi:hypothetical protein